jgi:hypothetical protein
MTQLNPTVGPAIDNARGAAAMLAIAAAALDEHGVAIGMVEADQLIEERPREVLDPARHRGTHPAQVDECVQRHVGPRRLPQGPGPD